jgi:hypothetical protein
MTVKFAWGSESPFWTAIVAPYSHQGLLMRETAAMIKSALAHDRFKLTSLNIRHGVEAASRSTANS